MLAAVLMLLFVNIPPALAAGPVTDTAAGSGAQAEVFNPDEIAGGGQRLALSNVKAGCDA